MRVLFTNNTLDERAGTELYVRDMALALLDRGHEPIAYSRRLGEVGRELRSSTVPVLDDLEALEQPPDLIHGQHHLETMTALARFPGTPALYFCHGWLPDEEAPPLHPRILRYVAVDDLVRQRLLDECGVSAKRVETHRNFVNLERFSQRGPLPQKPGRALVFSNLVSEDNCLPALREACFEMGLELDTLGMSMGPSSADPEALLGQYDVVFAKGRAALEAAAVGAAVVLCDRSGFGGLVTSSSVQKIRRFNFGVRLLRQKVTVQAVIQALREYDPADAMEVTRFLRQEADLNDAVDKLLALYETILAESAGSSFSRQEEAIALSRYLRWGPMSPGGFFQTEQKRLEAEAEHARTWAADLQDQLNRAFQIRKDLEARLSVADAERQRFSSSLNESRQEASGLPTSLDEAGREGTYEDQISDQKQTIERLEAAAQRQCEEASLQAEEASQEALLFKNRIADLENELAWIQATRVWTLRERLLGNRWVARVYRLFLGRQP